MLAILQITNGPTAGARAVLRPGQRLKVGRTEWADFSVPHDRALADVHFELQCTRDNCLLTVRDAQHGATLNGQPVKSAEVHDGETIAAGGSTFVVRLEGALKPSPASDAASAADKTRASGFANVAAPTAAELCARCEPSDEAAALLTPQATPKEFLSQLIAAGLWIDAIKFLAHALPPREAVQWGVLCLRGCASPNPTPSDTAALEAAAAWAAEPNEARRRAAESAAAATGHSTAAGFLAQAAFWSGDLAPTGAAAPVPPPGLTARGLIGALLLAAAVGPAAQIPTRYAAFMQHGQAIAK